MNIVSTLKTLISDAIASPVKDQRITLSQEQAAILDRELVKSNEKVVSFTIRVSELEEENANLHAKIKQMEEANDGLSEPQEKILQFLHQFSHSVSIADVIRRLGISVGDFEFHVGELVNKRFVNKRIKWIAANEDNMGESNEEVVGILQAGRAYLMNKKG